MLKKTASAAFFVQRFIDSLILPSLPATLPPLMSYKDILRAQREAKARTINTSAPSRWRQPILAIVLVLLILGAAATSFPGTWNKTAGRLSFLQVTERPFRLGLDLLGGSHLVYTTNMTDIEPSRRDEALEGVRDVIERRVNAFGVAEPVVQTTSSGGSSRVIVELAGISDVNEAIKQIGETPILEFKRPPIESENDVAPTDAEKEYNDKAKSRAETILTRALTGESFDGLVKESSEGPQASQNGISAWVDEFDARSKVLPLKGAKKGAVYKKVLEKDQSYSVVLYYDTRNANDWLSSEIVVCYSGASGCEGVARTKEEAKTLAREIKDSITPDNFASIANEKSDAKPANGGDLGWRRQNKVELNPAFLLASLQVNDIGVTDSSRGYTIIWKRGNRSYKEYSFQEVEIAKAIPGADNGAENWVNTQLNGRNIKRAGVELDQQTGAPFVTLTFDSEGAKLFGELTKEHVGRQIAIFLDGRVISAPVVQQEILGGQAVITGLGGLEEAKLLSQRLNAGALPVPISLVSQETVGPTLGQASLDRSLNAAIIGIVLVALFMILYYRLPGIISVIALAAYSLFVLWIFKFLPVTLTLPGLAGFVLSVGMAVDANVLIFERLKEELRAGHSLSISLENGFKRAWPAIRDGNVTTILACAILYWLSSSFIQGFALTLTVGVFMSMFSAIAVTRIFLALILRIGIFKKAWLIGVKEMRA
ncbi:MAG: protein translocase subunit SecD [Patescibacteria group bacterium]